MLARGFFRILFIGFVIGVCNPVFLGAQKKIEKGILQWKQLKIFDNNKNEPVNVLFFDQGILRNDYPIAYFENKVATEQNVINPVIKFIYAAFEEIPTQDLSIIESVIKDIDSITFKTYLVTEKKQTYIAYSFLPVRKNPTTGHYERLTHYILEITNQTNNTFFETSKLANTNVLSSGTNNSVLNTGDWFKFSITKNGVYKISYDQIKSLGIQNPELVKIYGNGGSMLPEKYTGTEINDLKEIPIQIVSGTDGIFNAGDYILFYAQGPVVWTWNASTNVFNYSQHKFTNGISYFLTSGPSGKKISTATVPMQSPNVWVTSYDYNDFHENDQYNLIRSGRELYGEKFSYQTTSYSFTFDIPFLVTDENIYFQSSLLARARDNTVFTFSSGGKEIAKAEIYGFDTYSSVTYAATKTITGDFNSTAGKTTINISYDYKNYLPALGWLDFIKIRTRQYLKMIGYQTEFCDTKSIANGNIAEYTLEGASNQIVVWDITDIHNVSQYPTTLQGTQLKYIAPSSSFHKYLAFDSKYGPLPVSISSANKTNNQNLHELKNIDFIIVAHPKFLSQAQELADLHRTKDNLSVYVTTPEIIYNEFSSGNPDPAAIRNFAKMVYDSSDSGHSLKYLLLFGDGSYLRKSTESNNPNYILTYQSENSLNTTESYTSDDYYGLLDKLEDITYGQLDIGVGRFPVQSEEDADNVLNKIKRYYSVKNMGDWRNSICFIGDDEDGGLHMDQSDKLAQYVNQNYPNFNINKIYLDAFEQISTASGDRYPDVTTAIYDRLNQGSIIVNYTGHGNEKGLTSELVIRQKEDIQKWTNTYLPVFITATCEFSRYDDANMQTAGEDILLNQYGGGIALLTTTRVAYSGPNFVLNLNFYKNAFEKNADGEPLTLGEIFLRTKNASGSGTNKLIFTLLGDPAIKLPYPVNSIQTDSIDGNTVTSSDTIRALQTVRISGSIKNKTGNNLDNFNGTIYPIIFDKAHVVNTLSNDGEKVFSFTQQNNILYKGQATVKNGLFNFTCIVPRDIDYNYNLGKISYYAKDASIDASGNFKNVVIGGLYPNAIQENKGPEISLHINDHSFVNGGITDEYPTLIADISDDIGINIGSSGIGHDLVATLDNNPQQQYLLNNYFISNLNDYLKGSITYKLPQLEPGLHTLSLKAWDINNNSSIATISFKVANGSSPVIGNCKVFPNPTRGASKFNFEHNISGESIYVRIDVYNFTGALVSQIKTTIEPSGYTSGDIDWACTGPGGSPLSTGMYFYRITIETTKGTAQSESKKLIIIE